MKSKYLAAALLGTALLTGAAFAQNPTTDRSNVNTAVHKEGQWRSMPSPANPISPRKK